MSNEEPTPIYRDAEMQSHTVEGIRDEARKRYRELGRITKNIDDQIEVLLSNPPSDEAVDRLSYLFDKKRSVDQIARQLEEIILGAFGKIDELRQRWNDLEKRII